MGAFHVLRILQMVPNRVKRLILTLKEPHKNIKSLIIKSLNHKSKTLIFQPFDIKEMKGCATDKFFCYSNLETGRAWDLRL